MTAQTSPKNTFGHRMRSAIAAFMRGLIRLVAILVVVAAVIALVYILPRLNHAASAENQMEREQMQEMYAQQTELSQQMERQLDSLRQRVQALELRSDSDKQALDEIQAELEKAARDQQNQIEALSSTQYAASQDLAQINAALENLDQRINRLINALNQTSSDLKTLDEQVSAIDERLSSSEAPLVIMQRELVQIKAMEILTRSRLYLVQNNFGLAKDEIRAARHLLASLAVPDYQQAALAAIIERLDLASANLPDSPILAAEDLEIAWQLLRGGLPQAANLTATAAVTADSSLQNETTPTPTPSIEPTPQSSPEATPTPTPTP